MSPTTRWLLSDAAGLLLARRGRIVIFAAMLFCAACSDGGPERESADGLPVGTDVSTCDELVADPLFGNAAEVMVAVATPRGSPPDGCTLTVDRDATVLDTLGVDAMCPPGSSVLVAVHPDSSGTWQVDLDNEQLGTDGCLYGR